MTSTVTAVLLVGGQSSRMGQDKSLLQWEGRPLWRHQLNTLAEINPERLAISGVGAPAWLEKHLVFFSDDLPGLGPLGALATILRRLETTHALLLAVDMPRMTSDFLRSLMREIRPGRGVIPTRMGEFEGLAAIFPKEAEIFCSPDLLQEDRSMHGLIRKLIEHRMVTLYLITNEQRCFFDNLNSPADLSPR